MLGRGNGSHLCAKTQNQENNSHTPFLPKFSLISSFQVKKFSSIVFDCAFAVYLVIEISIGDLISVDAARESAEFQVLPKTFIYKIYTTLDFLSSLII